MHKMAMRIVIFYKRKQIITVFHTSVQIRFSDNSKHFETMLSFRLHYLIICLLTWLNATGA